MSSKRIGIIGAGSSGIAAVKALTDKALEFECLEASDRIGGNWAINNPNGMSAAYESLHINTSRDRMAYADFPMPSDYPDFPGHQQIKQYFDDYVDHFALRQHIRFNCQVEHAESTGERWRLSLADGSQREYDTLLVANGHHWSPRWPAPDFPGQFSGTKIHSHRYLNPHHPIEFSGQRVLIVGAGNSAMDIACELARPGLTKSVVLSSRSPTWIIPRYLLGRPLDRWPQPPAWIHWRLRSALSAALLRLAVGTPDRYGAPRPRHPLFAAHPTVSQDIFGKLGGGDIRWKPNVERFDGDRVVFTDGSSAKFDVVVYCTGYEVAFPFFSDPGLEVINNDLPLWLRLVIPERRNLFFVGLLQPLGAIMPLAEAQSKWIADHLTGQIELPTPEAMHRQIAKERRRMFRRYRQSPRHTMQVDFDAYLKSLHRARRRHQTK